MYTTPPRFVLGIRAASTRTMNGKNESVRSGDTRCRHAAIADLRSSECFLGARIIRAKPMTTSTAEPPKNPPRSFACLGCKASADITTACAKLDHAAKAITLRCADG